VADLSCPDFETGNSSEPGYHQERPAMFVVFSVKFVDRAFTKLKNDPRIHTN